MQNDKKHLITLTKNVVFHLKKKSNYIRQIHQINLMNDTQSLNLSFFDIST